MRRAAVAALAALAAGVALAGDGAPRWQLLFFHPFRPGVLQQCQDAHRREDFGRMAGVDAADPFKAWVVQGPLELRWRGRTARACHPEVSARECGGAAYRISMGAAKRITSGAGNRIAHAK